MKIMFFLLYEIIQLGKFQHFLKLSYKGRLIKSFLHPKINGTAIFN